MTDPRTICVNRKKAAELLGVSVDFIKKQEEERKLRSRNTSFKEGRPVGVALYAYDELVAWFESLEIA